MWSTKVNPIMLRSMTVFLSEEGLYYAVGDFGIYFIDTKPCTYVQVTVLPQSCTRVNMQEVDRIINKMADLIYRRKM